MEHSSPEGGENALNVVEASVFDVAADQGFQSMLELSVKGAVFGGQFMISLNSLRSAPAADFTAGTVVLSYGHQHAKNRSASLGLRIGTTDKIFALTDWFDGRTKAGRTLKFESIVLGLSPQDYRVELVHDLQMKTTEWVSGYDCIGQVGLGRSGVRILSSIGERHEREAIIINPLTWELEAAFDCEWTLPGGAVRLVDTQLDMIAETISWTAGQIV